MTRVISILAALATLSCISAAPKEDAAKTDQQTIQGTWKFVSVVDQGKEQPWPEGNRLVISPDIMKVVYPKDDQPMGWKYVLDPSKDPKEMDWIVEIDPGHPIRQLAIYSLEGETLKICSAAAGKPRPTTFESKKGDFGGLWILKRAAPPPQRD